MYFLWYDVTPQVKEWVAGVKQVLILFFSPEVAHSDFPASQVSVQEHWKHLKVRYGVHKLWVEMKTCINTLCLAKVVTFFAIYNVKTTIIVNDFYYFILTLYDNEVECEEKNCTWLSKISNKKLRFVACCTFSCTYVFKSFWAFSSSFPHLKTDLPTVNVAWFYHTLNTAYNMVICMCNYIKTYETVLQKSHQNIGGCSHIIFA